MFTRVEDKAFLTSTSMIRVNSSISVLVLKGTSFGNRLSSRSVIGQSHTAPAPPILILSYFCIPLFHPHFPNPSLHSTPSSFHPSLLFFLCYLGSFQHYLCPQRPVCWGKKIEWGVEREVREERERRERDSSCWLDFSLANWFIQQPSQHCLVHAPFICTVCVCVCMCACACVQSFAFIPNVTILAIITSDRSHKQSRW